MRVQLHQLVHGYGKGHELLASSAVISPSDAELLVRLSDLSGSLPSESAFDSYVTIYPLPSRKYYAAARTWPDSAAPRTGCVLTHTLLIPGEHWASGEVSLRDVLALHSRPDRGKLKTSLNPIDLSSSVKTPILSKTSGSGRALFVSKYFSDGLKPVIWFDTDEAIELLVSITDQIWPKLRSRFSACTYSLQPRSLPDGPFDVLFAPSSLYSRFSKIPRENFIDLKDGHSRPAAAEPWCAQFEKYLFEGDGVEEFSYSGMLQGLGSDPASVRWLFMLNDLRARISASPMAALGAMDVVETLSPEPEPNLALKQDLIRQALSAADDLPAEKGLEHLYLVSERLGHPAFQLVAEGAQEEIRAKLARSAGADVDGALRHLEQLLTRSDQDDSSLSAYRSGLVAALSLIQDYEPGKLLLLARYPRSASTIIEANPDIAMAYVRSAGSRTAINDVVRWLRLLDREVLPFVIGVMTADAKAKDPVLLFDEVFSDLSENQLSEVLEVLGGRGGFRNKASLEIVQREIVPRASQAVRVWALQANDWTAGLASLVASTVRSDAAGLADLLSWIDKVRGSISDILAAYLLRVTERGFPRWLQDSSEHLAQIVQHLLQELPTSASGAAALATLLRRDGVLPLQVVQSAAHKLREVNTSSFGDLKVSLFFSALRWALRGDLPTNLEGSGFKEDELLELYRVLDGHRLVDVLTDEVRRSAEHWARAWLWLSGVPNVFFGRENVSVDVVNLLCGQAYSHWQPEIPRAWVDILNRAMVESSPRTCIRHCVKALQYCFKNTSLPLGEVVTAAFAPTYEVATVEPEPNYVDELDPLLSYSDWDRGKRLRGTLVDKFVKSEWRAGELALISDKTFGIRKLFKRVFRKAFGERYIEQIIRDLNARQDTRAQSLARELVGLLKDPYFYEPWV